MYVSACSDECSPAGGVSKGRNARVTASSEKTLMSMAVVKSTRVVRENGPRMAAAGAKAMLCTRALSGAPAEAASAAACTLVSQETSHCTTVASMPASPAIRATRS